MLKLVSAATYVAAVFLLAGCKSWDYDRLAYKQLCKDADWEQLYYDAEIQRGQTPNVPEEKLKILGEACPRHGIKPDLAAKAEAQKRVQREFCAFDRAYSYGREGNSQPVVCPSDFKVEWARGYREFLTRQLEYLRREGEFLATYNRLLAGMDVNKRNVGQYNIAKAEAERQATQQLKIKQVAIADDQERENLIKDYSKKLKELR